MLVARRRYRGWPGGETGEHPRRARSCGPYRRGGFSPPSRLKHPQPNPLSQTRANQTVRVNCSLLSLSLSGFLLLHQPSSSFHCIVLSLFALSHTQTQSHTYTHRRTNTKSVCAASSHLYVVLSPFSGYTTSRSLMYYSPYHYPLLLRISSCSPDHLFTPCDLSFLPLTLKKLKYSILRAETRRTVAAFAALLPSTFVSICTDIYNIYTSARWPTSTPSDFIITISTRQPTSGALRECEHCEKRMVKCMLVYTHFSYIQMYRCVHG